VSPKTRRLYEPGPYLGFAVGCYGCSLPSVCYFPSHCTTGQYTDSDRYAGRNGAHGDGNVDADPITDHYAGWADADANINTGWADAHADRHTRWANPDPDADYHTGRADADADNNQHADPHTDHHARRADADANLDTGWDNADTDRHTRWANPDPNVDDYTGRTDAHADIDGNVDTNINNNPDTNPDCNPRWADADAVRHA
jgi:hypothetical protein